ncbi:YciI family protein [Herbidospora daliensis]|uniref:YciI family protein n=1 Tax=Herbidospora daliensis TaxID=295585 RepID=UPI0007825A87|nr:YciI family protein [Herbidospora daliensis]
MKYMLLIHGASEKCTTEDWMVYGKALTDAGVYVGGAPLADQSLTTTVQLTDGGETVVTDGPFAETHEVLGGYYLIDVPDLDAATDWAAKCPGARFGGRMVVRPIVDFP